MDYTAYHQTQYYYYSITFNKCKVVKTTLTYANLRKNSGQTTSLMFGVGSISELLVMFLFH